MAETAKYSPATLAPSSAAVCYQLSTAAGWNQTEADWAFILSRGRGIGLFASDGSLAATGISLPSSEELEWIAMVVVREDLRRRGLGRRVMEELIDSSTTEGLALDATELGLSLYERLEFVEQERIVRLRTKFRSGKNHSETQDQRDDTSEIRETTKPSLRAELPIIVERLLRRSEVRCFEVRASDSNGASQAYLRPGRTAWHVGPVYADSADAALRLIGHVLTQCDGAVEIDVPVRHSAFVSHLTSFGFEREREFVRMVRGSTCTIPENVFAIAGPEYG